MQYCEKCGGRIVTYERRGLVLGQPGWLGRLGCENQCDIDPESDWKLAKDKSLIQMLTGGALLDNESKP